MTPTLRDYQADLIDRLRASMRQHRRVLAVSPTGSGKTVVFSWLAQQVAARGKRVVIVAHRNEIVEQISAALYSFGCHHGWIAPGRHRNGLPIQVAMVQTLGRRIETLQPPDLLVIDEAHHAVAGAWSRVADAWPRARILGVTATPERLDGRGLGDVFDSLIEGPTVAELIASRHLADYRHYRPPGAFDRTALHRVAGDFRADEVVSQLRERRIVGSAVEEYRKRADGLTGVAFCPTIKFAETTAAEFRDAGIPAASIDGGMSPLERARILGDLRSGHLKIVTSCDLISEGFDLPAVAAGIFLRPTASLSLYMQQAGRVLRPKPDGSRAIIIDHVGNGVEFGPVDAHRVWTLAGRKRRANDAPSISQCETCYRIVMSADRQSTAAACDRDPCGLAPAPEGAGRREIEQVAGELVEWTRHDLASAPLRDVLRDARTPEQLDAVRRARDYSPGWVRHVLASRAARHAQWRRTGR